MLQHLFNIKSNNFFVDKAGATKNICACAIPVSGSFFSGDLNAGWYKTLHDISPPAMMTSQICACLGNDIYPFLDNEKIANGAIRACLESAWLQMFFDLKCMKEI